MANIKEFVPRFSGADAICSGTVLSGSLSMARNEEWSLEEKIEAVAAGLKDEEFKTELCRR